jgi:hypothetical protein
MEPRQEQPGEAGASASAQGALDRFDVALEPGQAWCLKGLGDEPDEVVIPGLLLDDLGGCTSVEASLDLPTYYQMLAMVSVQEARMIAARNGSPPERMRPEANVWSLTGSLLRGRIEVETLAALDRVVVDSYGTSCLETMRASQILPGPKAWR